MLFRRQMGEKTGDALFTHIEAMHMGRHWGRVLDAGTGSHSLRWMTRLPSKSWTAVTARETLVSKLQRELGGLFREQDRLVHGVWTEQSFLLGETFDVVVADYLLGAVEGPTPYFQDRLFRRLKPHVAGRLYVVGLEPFLDKQTRPGADLIHEIARIRDACILLAGQRPYREYPMDWVVRNLEASGYRVTNARRFPNVYAQSYVERQLDVCERKLPHFRDRDLAGQMNRYINRLRARGAKLAEVPDALKVGSDYVVTAEPTRPHKIVGSPPRLS